MSKIPTGFSNFILDTNILLGHPNCIFDDTFAGAGHQIFIPERVIVELDRHKKKKDRNGDIAQKVGRKLFELQKKKGGDFYDGNGVENDFKVKIRIVSLTPNNAKRILFPGVPSNQSDHAIIKTAVQLKESGLKNVVMVSNDVFLCLKTGKFKIKTLEFQ